jgi:hypothetical protein
VRSQAVPSAFSVFSAAPAVPAGQSIIHTHTKTTPIRTKPHEKCRLLMCTTIHLWSHHSAFTFGYIASPSVTSLTRAHVIALPLGGLHQTVEPEADGPPALSGQSLVGNIPRSTTNHSPGTGIYRSQQPMAAPGQEYTSP